MIHLAVFYTNNSLSPWVLNKAVECFAQSVWYEKLHFPVKGVIISVEPLSFNGLDKNPFIQNIIAPKEILNKGHLSILEKILIVIKQYPAEYISLHEHDVLYPNKYLSTIQEVIQDVGPVFDYIAYNNIIGVNKTGYQQRVIMDHPLSTLTFSRKALTDLLEKKRIEYYANGNWCYLEPGYGGSYGEELIKLELGKGTEQPVVHVNMNETKTNHHFTNHYLTYEAVSKTGFNEWPGDLSSLFEGM